MNNDNAGWLKGTQGFTAEDKARALGAQGAFAGAMAKRCNEAMRFVNANRERLIEAWIAETGCLPSESELVTTTDYSGSAITTTCYVRRRSPIQPDAHAAGAAAGDPGPRADWAGYVTLDLDTSDDGSG